MQKFEYEVMTKQYHPLTKPELNRFGFDGWELVQVTVVVEEIGAYVVSKIPHFTYTFKRKFNDS